MVNTTEFNKQVTDFIPLISIYNQDRTAIVRFQSFTNSVYTFQGENYSYLDAVVSNTSGRQSYYAAVTYQLRIRDSPTRSQLLSLETPGLTISTLSFLINNNGGRRSSVLIRYLNSVNLLPNRIGIFQIVGASIQQKGLIILNLNTGIVRVPVTNYIR